METPVTPIPVTLHTRREFCARACQSASVLAAGALAACSGGGDSPTGPSNPDSTPQLSTISGSVTGRSVSVNIDSGSPLANVGSAALINTSIGNFLATRTAQESFTTVTAVCTHEGCTVTGFNGTQYVCPCHGSRYTTSGSVVNGPATRSLQQFPSSFANGVLTFTA